MTTTQKNEGCLNKMSHIVHQAHSLLETEEFFFHRKADLKPSWGCGGVV